MSLAKHDVPGAESPHQGSHTRMICRMEMTNASPDQGSHTRMVCRIEKTNAAASRIQTSEWGEGAGRERKEGEDGFGREQKYSTEKPKTQGQKNRENTERKYKKVEKISHLEENRKHRSGRTAGETKQSLGHRETHSLSNAACSCCRIKTNTQHSFWPLVRLLIIHPS